MNEQNTPLEQINKNNKVIEKIKEWMNEWMSITTVGVKEWKG